MMKRLLLIASSPAPGLEEEFNRWYSEVHLPEVVALPGVIGAQRFGKSADTWPSMRPQISQPYVAIYELSPDVGVAEVMNDLSARTADGRMVLSPALDKVSLSITGFDALTGWVAGA